MLISAERIVPAAGPVAGPATVLAPGYVACSGGRITEVGAGRPPTRPDLELDTGTLVPGLVDLQVNGYFGVELADADRAGWELVARQLPGTGVTAFLPTFITSPLDRLAAALRRSAGIVPGLPAEAGARVLGIHVEGPFISRKRCGAHNPDWLAEPAPASVAALVEAGAGLLKLVTLAPELDGALAAIAQLATAGVAVSLGHTDAIASQVGPAVAAGARLVTHLFNAQRPLHHREPGLIGVALTDPRLSSGLIADLRHVSAEVIALAFAAAPGRVFLVTDAAPCAGQPPGEYLLGGEPITLPPGEGAAPVRADGTLAGSALRLDAAVGNLVAAGAGLAAAVAAATVIPAGLIGRPDLGRITAGAAADLTWLGEDLRARATWIGGRQVYP